MVAGCGADVLINICLTVLGYFPGHIHAFYLEYIYYKRKETGYTGPAGGVFSDRVLYGGHSGERVSAQTYGNGANNYSAPPSSHQNYAAPPPAQQGYAAPPMDNQQYGTVPAQQGTYAAPVGAKY